jgi:RimJ/RimL family protein N-acetyltransferase
MNIPNTITFRKLTSKDVAQYHYIRLECLKNYPENFGTLYEEEVKATSFKFDSIISEVHKTDFLMGAYNDKELIGICGFIKEKRNKTKHIGEISSMYVKPTMSGQHIGSQLLQQTIALVFGDADVEQIILAVMENNIHAQYVYKKIGFEEYGRLPNYFKHNGNYETQIFMTLIRK